MINPTYANKGGIYRQHQRALAGTGLQKGRLLKIPASEANISKASSSPLLEEEAYSTLCLGSPNNSKGKTNVL